MLPHEVQNANEFFAFMDGGHAWEDGHTLTSNPHSWGTSLWGAWRDGWFSSERSFREEGDCALGKPYT